MEEEEGATDPALDFLSPLFDPSKALQASSSSIALPCPEVLPCDNIHQYQSLVRGRARRGRGAGVSRRQEATLEKEKSKRETNLKTVLDFMTAESTTGPMSLLQRCYQDQLCVAVVIRHSAGVRGVCMGRVVVFDQHFNLVLADVTEQYTPLRTLANGGKTDRKKRRRNRREPHSDFTPCVRQHGSAPPQLTDTSTADSEPHAGHEPAGSGGGVMCVGDSGDGAVCAGRRWELRRHVKQLFIRGDNVVLITPLASSSLPGQYDTS